MGVVVKHLKQLSDGRWQYRRVWPKNVKAAVPDLTNEVKKVFPKSTSKSAAIQWALRQDQSADALIAKVRSGAAEIEREEHSIERVARWFQQERNGWDEVAITQWSTDDCGQPIEVEETFRELEVERIVAEAARRSGTAPDGSPKAFTSEERLKLEALRRDEAPRVRMTLRRAIDFYVERQRGGRDDKATAAAREQALEYFGDIPLDRLSRAMASDWTHALAKSRGQSAATTKKRIGSLKAVINFAKVP